MVGPERVPLKWSRDGVTYEFLARECSGVLLLRRSSVRWGRSLADLPWQQRVLSVLLRVLFCSWLRSAGPSLSRTEEKQQVCSVFRGRQRVGVGRGRRGGAPDRGAWARAKGQDVSQVDRLGKRPRSSIRRRARPAARTARAGAARPVERTALSLRDKPTAGSNLQSGAARVRRFSRGYLKARWLLSDGVETDGDVLAEPTARAASA